MSQEVNFKLLKVGCCFHPEAIVHGGVNLAPMVFPAVVGLIRHPTKGYVLFDTGYAERFNSETRYFPERFYSLVTPINLAPEESLLAQLVRLNIDPNDINYIFVSHFHADHISGLIDFPNAKIICSKLGLDSILERSGLRAVVKGYLPKLLPANILQNVIYIEDRPSYRDKVLHPFNQVYDVLGDGYLLAINLPGHAFGHYGLMINDGNESKFMIGDACWTERAYKENKYPNRLAHIIMSNANQYRDTIQKISTFYHENNDVLIIPSHCSDTFKRVEGCSKC